MPWSSARWRNFSKSEIACPHCGKVILDCPALDALQKLRDLMQAPININSAFRCLEHNKAVGGAKGSLHLLGKAFDIRIDQHDRRRLFWTAEVAGFRGLGFMVNALHVDTRKARTLWHYGPESEKAWAGIMPPGTKLGV